MGLPLYRPSPSPEPVEDAEKTAAHARSSIRRRRTPRMAREDRSLLNISQRESEYLEQFNSRRGPREITRSVATDEAEPFNPFTARVGARRERRERPSYTSLQRRELDEEEDENDHHLRTSIDAVVDGPLESTPSYPGYTIQRRRLDDTEAALRSLRESRADIARLQALLRDHPLSSSSESLRETLHSRHNLSHSQNLTMLTTPSDSGATSRVTSPQLPTPTNNSRTLPAGSASSRPSSRPASVLAELPPLARVSARPNQSRFSQNSAERYREWRDQRDRTARSRLDGLGDRERSVSSEGDGTWETLVSTMTPDPQPASASSSFVSASAAASVSSRSMAGTSSTSMTTIGDSETAPVPDICDSEPGEDQCELEGPGESIEEDADQEEDEEAYFRALVPPEANNYVSYADVVSNSASGRLQHRLTRTDFETVDRWQPIIRALSRLEDIPDEWWAEAGLARILQEETMA